MDKILNYLRQFKPFAVMGNQISDPIKWRRLNGWLVVFWTGMFVVSIAMNLLSIVAFISVLSLYANWATHLGVWAASRAEAKQVDAEAAIVNAQKADITADEVDVHTK